MARFFKPAYHPDLDLEEVYIETAVKTSRTVQAVTNDELFEVGFLYAPYIPMFSTPTLVSAEFFSTAYFSVLDKILNCFAGKGYEKDNRRLICTS